MKSRISTRWCPESSQGRGRHEDFLEADGDLHAESALLQDQLFLESSKPGHTAVRPVSAVGGALCAAGRRGHRRDGAAGDVCLHTAGFCHEQPAQLGGREPIVKRDQDRAGGGQVCPAGGFSDAVSGGDGRRAAHTGCGQSVCGSGWIYVFWQIYDNTVSFCTAGLCPVPDSCGDAATYDDRRF